MGCGVTRPRTWHRAFVFTSFFILTAAFQNCAETLPGGAESSLALGSVSPEGAQLPAANPSAPQAPTPDVSNSGADSNPTPPDERAQEVDPTPAATPNPTPNPTPVPTPTPTPTPPPAPKASISFSTANLYHDEVLATVTNGPGNTSDWVGLVKIGTTSEQLYDWVYLNDTRTRPATGLTSATVHFHVYSSGTYQLVFFERDGYTELARSATFTIRW